MKTVIAFFYLLNGSLTAYTVSDYNHMRAERGIPESRTCELLISDMGFMADIRDSLKPGESARAACYLTGDLMNLGNPAASVQIEAN